MNKKYIVRLSEAERSELSGMVDIGKAAAYRIKHANILLKVDADGPCWTDNQAAEAFNCHARTVRNIRQRFVESGFHAALERKKQSKPSRKRSLDGEGEARLIALRCGDPPEGFSRWTLHLLADKLVELNVVESISHETVRQTLKKTNLSLICASSGSSRAGIAGLL